MSPAIKLILENLQGNLQFAQMTVADMTDAELLQRPCPQSNPGLYQIGHIVCAEGGLMAKYRPGCAQAPEAWLTVYFAPCPSDEELAKVATKDQLMAEFTRLRQETIKVAESLSDADLDKPSNVDWAPTVGKLMLGLDNHMWMHWGQLQVLRRKLGKPVLF